jgi:hypothetical protein
MDYEVVDIKSAKVIYCITCKKDPKSDPQDLCNDCLLREIWIAEYAEMQEEH